ncbi:1-acylglycerol-3-phosphate O-acyltransferase (plasmid) [Photobacterium sp. GJ3]|uniref:1-acylglycerol-3-phosphate O-acyltransferase n=1 Tax=Photobacterium sp. GJ3 TaxID=2829502 RepID=UPI001B8B07FA|nr:1-acylglycerol-3-phosphate O-acyltransferase [Photobacterium sp. GJ3]QUJ69278.1 1-acylglycerol-3-phosphate O-acyltransferase [Photobacterium sp. GJ3]
MLAFIRLVLAAGFIMFTCLFALIYCLFSPRDPKHVYFFSQWFKVLRKIVNVQIIERGSEKLTGIGNAVYISNHQSVFDFVTSPGMVRPRTVSIGKKSLLWIPFFGPLYWITGNILLDRENKAKARDTIQQVASAILNRNLSVWMYPEGTRSKGRGLLPFKSGAFRMAIEAGVPIVPMVVSSTHNQINLSNKDNGIVIAEYLDPIETSGLTMQDARALADHCHQMMLNHIATLDAEVASLSSESAAIAAKPS